jgi:hypothetical protein
MCLIGLWPRCNWMLKTLDPKYDPKIAFGLDGLTQSLTRPQFLRTLEHLGISPIAQLEAST